MEMIKLLVEKKSHKSIFGAIAYLLVLIGILTIFLVKNSNQLKQVENNRHKLQTLGFQLKESSENLTKYCRNYIVTGDIIWKHKYNNLLNIRNGIKPRPNGSLISLRDSILKLGISNEESEKLLIAENISNELVKKEEALFELMKSKQLANNDLLFLQKLVYDKEYLEIKKSIMTSINEFRKMLDQRTLKEVNKRTHIKKYLLFFIFILLITVIIISFFAIIIFRKKIDNQILRIEQSYKTIKLNEASLIEKNKKIKKLNTSLKNLVATKDKFFSIISHDLKDPISSIQGLSDLLINDFNDYSNKEIKEIVTVMNCSINQTSKLLDNLLSWAMIQTGKIEPTKTKIKPSELLDNVRYLCNPLAVSKDQILEIKMHSDEYIYADKEMIKTVLRNLTNNSIKFTNEKGHITIETKKQNNKMLFTVSDTGIGIDSKHIDNLFNINSKSTIRGTRGGKGSGLGLLLCKEFISSNNGEIWVKSDKCNGSTFYFTVPLHNKESS